MFGCMPPVLAYGVRELDLGSRLVSFGGWRVSVLEFSQGPHFHGDAGSGFLGVVFGIISIQAAWIAPQLLWAWLNLLGVFVVDATFTLIRRLVRGDKIYEAHRSHVYQIASRRYGKHVPVSLAVGMINIVWLLPIALCVTYFRLEGVLALVVAYTPLLILAIKFHLDEIEKEPGPQ